MKTELVLEPARRFVPRRVKVGAAILLSIWTLALIVGGIAYFMLNDSEQQYAMPVVMQAVEVGDLYAGYVTYVGSANGAAQRTYYAFLVEQKSKDSTVFRQTAWEQSFPSAEDVQERLAELRFSGPRVSFCSKQPYVTVQDSSADGVRNLHYQLTQTLHDIY